MKDNSVMVNPSKDGPPIYIYLNEIDIVTDEYINGLDNPEDIFSAPIFMGLLKRIYIRMFKPQKNMPHNSNSILVCADAETIADLWDKFVGLCFKYHVTPTILKFATMTGLDRTTFQTWKDGSYRNANPAYSVTAKKMYQDSESALESKAVDQNSIGGIFGLKANFAWRETAPIAAETVQVIQHDTAEQIAARYANATLPKKPDFDD